MKKIWLMIPFILCIFYCDSKDGARYGIERMGFKVCESNEDCGAGSYCNGESYCQSDCRWNLPDPDLNDCYHFGSGLLCNQHGRCVKESELEDGDGSGVDVTELSCDNEEDCVGYGFKYGCGESGLCEELPDGIVWGDPDDVSTAQPLEGIWGMIVTSAVTNYGIPIVSRQDVVTYNYALARITHEAGVLTISEKVCHLKILGFNEDDTPVEYNKYVWMEIPNAYVNSLLFQVHHVEGASSEKGSTFDSDIMLEIRGAKLDDPANDPLPTMDNLEKQWDQDEDGNPGMTTIMRGVVDGEVYNAQRWSAILSGEVVDIDHIKGLVETTGEATLLGASNDALLYEITYEMHDQLDRSYFRLQRFDDDATCEDMMDLATTEGEWLFPSPHLDDITLE